METIIINGQVHTPAEAQATGLLLGLLMTSPRVGAVDQTGERLSASPCAVRNPRYADPCADCEATGEECGPGVEGCRVPPEDWAGMEPGAGRDDPDEVR